MFMVLQDFERTLDLLNDTSHNIPEDEKQDFLEQFSVDSRKTKEKYAEEIKKLRSQHKTDLERYEWMQSKKLFKDLLKRFDTFIQ